MHIEIFCPTESNFLSDFDDFWSWSVLALIDTVATLWVVLTPKRDTWVVKPIKNLPLLNVLDNIVSDTDTDTICMYMHIIYELVHSVSSKTWLRTYYGNTEFLKVFHYYKLRPSELIKLIVSGIQYEYYMCIYNAQEYMYSRNLRFKTFLTLVMVKKKQKNLTTTLIHMMIQYTHGTRLKHYSNNITLGSQSWRET